MVNLIDSDTIKVNEDGNYIYLTAQDVTSSLEIQISTLSSSVSSTLDTFYDNKDFELTEHDTGKTWIDGRIVYARVWDFSFSSGGGVFHAGTMPDYYNITLIEGVQYGTSGAICTLDRAASSFANQMTLWVNELNQVTVEVGSEVTGTQALIYIEYTKENDYR